MKTIYAIFAIAGFLIAALTYYQCNTYSKERISDITEFSENFDKFRLVIEGTKTCSNEEIDKLKAEIAEYKKEILRIQRRAIAGTPTPTIIGGG